MKMSQNKFKQAIKAGKHQVGLWITLQDAYSIEILANSGFDWLLLDSEHSPNDLNSILHKLQVMAAYDTTPIVRPTHNDPVEIKRYLDIGVQTFLVPFVETAEQAEEIVRCLRYPPRGHRGMGGWMRANHFGKVSDYLQSYEEQICLLVQVENKTGLENLKEIAAVDGVDGVFIGPTDLSASLGYLGQPEHPEMQKVIVDAISQIKALGKAPGMLAFNKELAPKYIQAGSLFTAVGMDTGLLVQGAQNLIATYKS